MTILHTTPPLAPPASTPIAGEPFANAIWNALHSTHRHLALATGRACKYPADVAPFAALSENTSAALRDLHSLLEPQEATYVRSEGTPLRTDGLRYEGLIATPSTSTSVSDSRHCAKFNSIASYAWTEGSNH